MYIPSLTCRQVVCSTSFNDRKDEESGTAKLEGRWEFVGNLAPVDIRKKYRYKSVEHYFERGNSNPVMYVKVK